VSTPIPDFEEFKRRRAPRGGSAVDARLDSFVGDVITEASRRTGYTYKFGEGVRTPEQQAEKVRRGVSWTYTSRHLSGRGRDVLAFDERGNYITDGSHPAYTALGEVYGELAPEAPVRVKWGVVRKGAQVDPGHFEIEDGAAPDAVPAGGVPDFEEFKSALASPAAAAPDFEEFKAALGDPLAGVDVQPGEEVVREATKPVPVSTAVPAPPAVAGGKFYRVAVGDGTPAEAAASYLSKVVGAPVEFVREWLGPTRLEDPQTKQTFETSPTGHVALPADMVDKLRVDYDRSLGVGGRLLHHLDEAAQHTPFEHVAGVVGSLPEAVGAALTPISRPAEVLDAQFFSRLNRPGVAAKLEALGNPFDLQALGDAYKTLKGDRPESARNPIAEDVERDMSTLHPTIGKAYGVLADLIFSPSSALGAAGALRYANRFNKVAGLARAGKVEAAAAEAERLVDLARSATDAERLAYARTRAAHYAQEAQAAKSAGARRVAQELADDYAAEVKTLESGGPVSGGPDDFPVSLAAEPLPSSGARPSLLRRVARGVSDVLQLPKAKAGFDLSATARQGLPQVAAHPSYLRRAYVEQVKAFKSEENFNTFVEGIRSRGDFGQMQDAGLYLSHVGAGPEEVFTSGLARRIPGVAASDRAYSAALDSIRLSAWDNYVSSLPAHLRDNPETLKAVAELINVSTGRGVVPVLDRSEVGRKIVELANLPFWSPRNLAGKFNVLSPLRVVRNVANPATRPVAWLQTRDAFRGLTTMGTTLGLMHFAGLDVGLSPFKPDFGKVRLGDKVVVDLTGGEGFTVRYLAQMAQSFADIEGGKEPKKTPMQLTAHYLRSQLQPSASVGVDFATGERFGSTKENPKPFTYTEAAADLTVPFVAESVYDGWVASGGSTLGEIDEAGARGDFLRGDFSKVKAGFKYTPAALLSVLGLGVGFYEKPKDYAEAAERAKIQPGGVAGEELKRLGVVLGDLPKGQRVRVADNFKYEGLQGDSVGFKGQHAGQTPEDLQRFRDELTRQLETNIAAEVAKLDYQKLGREKQRVYLLQVVKATHSTVENRFLRDARRREVETLEDFERYQKELESRGPGVKPGEALKLGEPRPVSEVIGSKWLAEPGEEWASLSLLGKARQIENDYREGMRSLKGRSKRQQAFARDAGEVLTRARVVEAKRAALERRLAGKMVSPEAASREAAEYDRQLEGLRGRLSELRQEYAT
jgi:hypothetical protein